MKDKEIKLEEIEDRCIGGRSCPRKREVERM